MKDKERQFAEGKFDEADSHFEALNMNKYDCQDLKDKNLVIAHNETQYVDPADGEVKDVRNNPDVDCEEVLARNPDALLQEN